MCVYHDWHQDYYDYLCMILDRLKAIKMEALSEEHIVHLGDSRHIELPSHRFATMITSPPYPNHRDFSSIFAPENACLEWLVTEKYVTLRLPDNSIIGSNFVSGKSKPKVQSASAKRFLNAIEQYKGTKQAEYDNKVYYLPYFANYFADLEQAYQNIAPSLQKDFEGYIVVVNNTARNEVIPVAACVMEIWQSLRFNATIHDSIETFHVGTKNPRARGFKAKHTEYIIRIGR